MASSKLQSNPILNTQKIRDMLKFRVIRKTKSDAEGVPFLQEFKEYGEHSNTGQLSGIQDVAWSFLQNHIQGIRKIQSALAIGL